VSGIADVPPFDREALIEALRTDQAGESTFLEFLAASRSGNRRIDFALLRFSLRGFLFVTRSLQTPQADNRPKAYSGRSEWRVIRPKIPTLPSKEDPEDPCDGAGGRRSGRRLPSLEPWAHAVFQLGDCARRNAFIIRVCVGDIVRETLRCKRYVAPVEFQACRLGVCVGRSTQTTDTPASTGFLRLEFERFREGYSVALVERPRKNG
jgi:hypothetical protein